MSGQADQLQVAESGGGAGCASYSAPFVVEQGPVGCYGSALYLLSDLSRGVTGEVHHVDCGYHIVGMKNPDAPDIATV